MGGVVKSEFLPLNHCFNISTVTPQHCQQRRNTEIIAVFHSNRTFTLHFAPNFPLCLFRARIFHSNTRAKALFLPLGHCDNVTKVRAQTRSNPIIHFSSRKQNIARPTTARPLDPVQRLMLNHRTGILPNHPRAARAAQARPNDGTVSHNGGSSAADARAVWAL